MKTPISLFKFVDGLRKSLAFKIGCVGFGIFSISLYLKQYVTEPWMFLPELSFRIGESLIVVGFIAYILEHHTISKYIIEEMTGSILDDVFMHHFSREQMKDFITKYVKYYNKYEYIEPEVEALLQEHGIPEMTDKPRRENVKVTIEHAGDLKEHENLIFIKKSFFYRAINGAKKLPEIDYKFLNKSGMIFGTTIPLYEKIFNKSDPENSIKTYFKFSFKYRPSFSANGMKADKWHEIKDVTYLPKSQFDPKKCKRREITPSPKIYFVYDIISHERADGKDSLEVSLYSNIAIPPEEHMDIEFNITHPSEDSNMIHYNIISFTHNLSYSLKFDEMLFKTGVEDNIIGKGSGISDKSSKSISYTGWILPHSSVSCFWSRIKSGQERD